MMLASISPVLLKVLDWLIDKKIFSDNARRSFIEFVENRAEKQKSSKDLSDSYWEQVNELKRKRSIRNHQENVMGVKVSLTGRLAIVIGHEAELPGAYGVSPLNMYEWHYGCKLAAAVVRRGNDQGLWVKSFLRDGIGIKNVYQNVLQWNPNAIIELHFNAFNTKVTGTEILYTDHKDHAGIREKLLAQLIQKELCIALHRTGKEDRGIKCLASGDGERGFKNISQTNDIPSILVEPFFGDNSRDAELGKEFIEEMAQSIIDGFQKWLA